MHNMRFFLFLFSYSIACLMLIISEYNKVNVNKKRRASQWSIAANIFLSNNFVVCGLVMINGLFWVGGVTRLFVTWGKT